MPQLTPDQINKLKALGIEVNDQPTITPLIQETTSVKDESPLITPEEINPPSETQNTLQPQISLEKSPILPPNNQQIFNDSTKSSQTNDFNQNNSSLDSNSKNLQSTIYHQRPIFPLLSISGLTLLSLSGLILFKNKDQTDATPVNNTNTTLPETSVSPTQVPKSIQHYLLTSQQFFTQASQNQNVEALNQSIVAATEAIKEFPNDYRGYYQRGRIYQSVAASQPQVVTQVIADLSQAQKLNPNDAEITRSLASVYALKGDAQNTISYLSQTIALDPTKAQNFYDLAKIQQQVGLLSQAVETYDKLLTILSDPTQKTQVESEKSSLQKLISQNPQAASPTNSTTPIALPATDLPSSLDSPTIQANTGLPALVAELPAGLIVAAPEKIDQIEVSNITGSNSLSGNDTLASGQKEITLTNNQVTSASQIYVSILSGGKNQNLQVLSKSDKSFTIGLDTAISEDIQFKWWIIN